MVSSWLASAAAVLTKVLRESPVVQGGDESENMA